MSAKVRDPATVHPDAGSPEEAGEVRRNKAMLKTGALQDAILNSANFSSIATDARGVIQLFNVGAERMLGYAAADVVNMITPAEISDQQELVARALALSLELGTQILPGFDALVYKASRGIEDIYELTYIRKDGSRFPAVVSVTALRDAGNEIIGYLLIGTDNSARKQAEAARVKSEEWANFALQTTHTAAWDLDLADNTIQRTLEHDRIFGYGSLQPEWTYEKFLRHVLPEDRAEVDLKFREARAAQAEWNFQCRIRRGDGELRWIWAVGQHQCDKTGQRRRFAGIVQDITELKQTEKAQLKANALQGAIFNSANFSSIATDDMGVIQIFNIGAERMLGYTAAEVVNKITPANISDPQEVIARAKALSLELGTSISPGFDALVFKASRGIEDIYELTYIRKDGSRFPAIVSVTALRDAQGGIIGYLLIGTDNSARKQAEAALLKAGALQSAIFHSANFSSIATDAKGVIQIFNVGAERMLGYAAADVLNKITPADISDPQEVIARAKALSLELGTPISPGFDTLVFKASRGIEDIYELTYIRKDGSRFPAIVSVTALRDAQGGIIGYLLIGTDNSARKEAEAALLKAGALQNAIFNSANFSSIATDAKGVIQIFNVGAERMLGYAAADVLNKITPADISDPQEVIARAKALSLELGTSISPGFDALVFKASRGIEDIYELTYIRKDGSRFPAIVSVTALRDAEGGIIGYLLIGTDNSARKQIEEQLRWTQESFRLMVESVSDYAITMLDINGLIVSWNTGAQRIKGYSAEEIIGQHFSRFYLHEDIESGKPQQDLAAVAEQGRLEAEGWRVRKDGSTFWANEVYTAIRDQNGLLRGFAKLTRDLTRHREVEAELTSAKCLAEEANVAKSDFLSSMSHELRSPLNAILGFAQLMESDPVPPTPAQKESIAQILGAGWHLLKLIDEILDLAKVESGKVPLSKEPVSLTEVMLECQGMIEPMALQRGIQMGYPAFDVPTFVRADRTRLKQVLINLLSNAIKYNIQRGMVEVTCAESAPDRIRVSIRDTGPGLYPAQIAQLFQAFNRLGQESGGQEGTGIGLVVAKQLVELMGGVIGVESTVGLGSVFWFELTTVPDPHLSMEDADATASAQPAATRGAPVHSLLYVEDNPANLNLVEQIIARHPEFRLLTAVNGSSGIEIARLSRPDVILMDINLPGMSGFEALTILRADPATASIPVVALSANAMKNDIQKGMEAGFFRYMTKPIKVNEFMEAMNLAMEHAGNHTAGK